MIPSCRPSLRRLQLFLDAQERVTWNRTTWRAYEFLKLLGQAPVPEAVGRIVSEARIADGVTAFTGGEWRIVIEHIIDSESKGCASHQARPAGIVHFSRNSFLIHGGLAILWRRLLGIAGYRSFFNLRNEVGEIIGKLQVKSECLTDFVR